MKKSPKDRWLEEVNEVGRRLFEEANGWKLSREFTLEALAKGQPHGGQTRPYDMPNGVSIFDHPEFYKSTDGPPYRATCIVAHDYGSDESVRKACSEVAAKHGLIAHVLDDKAQSWWFPSSTTTVAFTRPDVSVVWPQWGDAVQPEPAEAATA